jgi:hypothetical protein
VWKAAGPVQVQVQLVRGTEVERWWGEWLGTSSMREGASDLRSEKMTPYIQTLTIKKLKDDLKQARKKINNFEKEIAECDSPSDVRHLRENIAVQELIIRCTMKELERRGK